MASNWTSAGCEHGDLGTVCRNCVLLRTPGVASPVRQPDPQDHPMHAETLLLENWSGLSHIVQKHHPFGGYVPFSVILYTQEQATLARNQATLAMDTTFRLGSYFVTMTIIKNENFARAGPKLNRHPVMVGPTLFHIADDFVTYDAFLSHLRQSILGLPLDVGDGGVVNDADRLTRVKSKHDKLKISLETYFNGSLRLCKSSLSSGLRRSLRRDLPPCPGLMAIVEAFEKVVRRQQTAMKNALFQCGDLVVTEDAAQFLKRQCGWDCCIFSREPVDAAMAAILHRRPSNEH